MGTYTDPALILPGVVGTTELADGAVTNAKVGAAAAIADSKLDLPSNLAVIGSGSYTGDSTANRAIPHNLGFTPVFVQLTDRSNKYSPRIVESGFIHNNMAIGDSRLAVTAADSTNFYVGNASDYNHSANVNTFVYDWVAFA